MYCDISNKILKKNSESIDPSLKSLCPWAISRDQLSEFEKGYTPLAALYLPFRGFQWYVVEDELTE
jgi:hypothetical protein